MPNTNPDGYEVRYIKLPENVYYDFAFFEKTERGEPIPKRLRRKIRDKQNEDATNLIMKTFQKLQFEAAKRLTSPITFRWIDPQGKILWSGAVLYGWVQHNPPSAVPTEEFEKTLKSENFDVDAFVLAMIDAMNDVKVPIFLVFEDAGGAELKFCLRFT